MTTASKQNVSMGPCRKHIVVCFLIVLVVMLRWETTSTVVNRCWWQSAQRNRPPKDRFNNNHILNNCSGQTTMPWSPPEAVIVGNGNDLMVEITIPGIPVAQPRPRGRLVSGRIVVFNPATREMTTFRRSIRQCLVELAVAVFPMFDIAVSLEVKAIFFVSNMRKDVDNMLKFVLDALQGVLYPDDRIIVTIEAKKVRCSVREQRTVVFVTATEEND